MFRIIAAASVAGLMTVAFTAPAAALTAKDKMATCKFGADDQKLKGKARDAFMKKCMAAEKPAPAAPAAPAPKS